VKALKTAIKEVRERKLEIMKQLGRSSIGELVGFLIIPFRDIPQRTYIHRQLVKVVGLTTSWELPGRYPYLPSPGSPGGGSPANHPKESWW
jgi:hypothetical protein